MIDVREKAAKQFSARLTGRGFESWVREVNDTYVVGGQEYMPQDLVVVRALDAAGNPVSAEVNVGIATFNLYPDTLTGGAVHGTHQTFAPMAPPVPLGYLLTGRSPSDDPSARVRSYSMSSSIGSRSTQRASDSPTAGSFGFLPVANSESVRCSRTRMRTHRAMSASNPMRFMITAA